MLKKCTLLGKLEEGKIVHTHLLNSHFSRDSVLLTTLINLYSKCGSLDDARQLFDEMPDKRDIVAWTALIAGFSQRDRPRDALVMFRRMLGLGLIPNEFTLSSVLKASSGLGLAGFGKWVHAILIKSQAKLVGFVGNTLLDMYAKSGSLEEAKKVFDRLLRRDVVSWNTLLKGYAQHGLGKTALRTLEKMLKIGIAPNDITFLCVLTACSHAGLVDEGFSIFSKMKKYDIEPDVSHYVTIVDLYGRAGQLELAEKSIREMPIEPTAAVWGALLGACRMHKKTELGIYAAERIFELDPHDSGPHMLLYNIYASAGRWAEATKVRKIMKESGVKKEPACSWVEIENEVHVFVADDDSHPDSEEIHAMIKQIGYKPDANHVLLCLDQREREVKLQHHSEKLALAFALLKTPPRSTIRIKKNIRVCGDCHSAFKLVSKVVNREIIVRDTNRFHHFREGSCSCRDYW
ncbi:Pentatricopeptide repeat-containing protein At3g24000, mitochondrial [Linum perenne]